MNIDSILDEWNNDSKIDKVEIGNESLKIAELHNKYLRIITQESLILRKLDFEYKDMYRLKWEYYLGYLDSDTMAERGWEPMRLKILKQDLDIYLSSDADIQKIQSRQVLQKEKIVALESIMKSITNRGFYIKNFIDFEKFKMGA
jgi:hypothetical protein